MRARILRSMMLAVVLAVAMLGVPLGMFVVNNAYQQTINSLNDRVRVLARVLDARILAGLPITKPVLAAYTHSDGGHQVQVEVMNTKGLHLVDGPELEGSVITVTSASARGLTVKMATSRSDVTTTIAVNLSLVAAVCVAALAAAAMLARRQANRLTQPLTMLAASANLLGSGQVRPSAYQSGIEEIDQVALELARSGERFGVRLAAEHEFAGDVSHQLRTPLAALLMRLEEIEFISKDEQVRAEARVGMEQVDRVVSVLEDLRSRARSSLGGTTEPLLLDDVVAQQKAEWEPVFSRHGRHLEFDVPADEYVLASPGGVAQVFATIIENALKHGGGTVTVRARESGRNKIVVEFADEGEGVPADIAPDIFERHVSSGGTGLGLTLARDMAAADGGRLELSRRQPAMFSLFLARAPHIDVNAILPKSAAPDPVRRRRRW